MRVVRVENLKKYYGGYKALDGISFSLGKGEILGIIGENGAGKSTTLKIMAGLLEPTSGSVEYFGMDFFKNMESLKKRIGFLPEFDALYENMKPIEYLTFFASFYGIKKEDAINLGKRLIKMFNLPEDRNIGSFSKGMMRKLSIARTLIHNPDILIYDEPTGGLDIGTTLFISELLKKLKKDGKTIIFSAHNMYYIESTCDKIVILKSGKMLYCGNIEELRDSLGGYKVIYIKDNEKKEILIESADDLNEVLREIMEDGYKILRVEGMYRRLEDIYVELLSKQSSK